MRCLHSQIQRERLPPFSMLLCRLLQIQEGQHYLGIDCNQVGTNDMRKQNVFETLQGKKQQLLLATQVRPQASTRGRHVSACFGWTIAMTCWLHPWTPLQCLVIHLANRVWLLLAQVCKMILKIDDGELRAPHPDLALCQHPCMCMHLASRKSKHRLLRVQRF